MGVVWKLVKSGGLVVQGPRRICQYKKEGNQRHMEVTLHAAHIGGQVWIETICTGSGERCVWMWW